MGRFIRTEMTEQSVNLPKAKLEPVVVVCFQSSHSGGLHSKSQTCQGYIVRPYV